MRTEKVNFYSEGIKLAGVLYPAGLRSGQTVSPESFKDPAFLASKTPSITS